ncbi:hypothetical protein PHLCEN_2v323 [Hermanssonia centrifuga]|uniref:BRCT domain-containing protein n=1 Tax=Hermanssonia centrifuga TaxID=98765 RepID=A0A2R6S6H1_9APHY|nr:hypothetical protein PHLCEN_2v323 [Hermanssonia centrifuga]
MAPARTSTRRSQRKQDQLTQNSTSESAAAAAAKQLFVDPLIGTPLALFVEKDVENRDAVVDAITKYGGIVSPGYSGVTYILVDPHKESGQNLYRQYLGKKNKLVLNVSWVHECVKAKILHGFSTNWSGCKVTGGEEVLPTQASVPPQAGPSNSAAASTIRCDMPNTVPVHMRPPTAVHPTAVYNANSQSSNVQHAPMYPQAPQPQPSAYHATVTHSTATQSTAPYPPPLYPPMHQHSPHNPSAVHPSPARTAPVKPTDEDSAASQPSVQATHLPHVSVQTVNGHPMPITASALDPLMQMAARQQQQQQQQQQRTPSPSSQPQPRQDEGEPSQSQFPYVYAENHLQDGPPQSWHASSGISPQQTHIAASSIYGTSEYRQWAPYPPQPPPDAMVSGPPRPAEYDYSYRSEHPGWVDGAEYYQNYAPPYPAPPPESYISPEADPSQSEPQPLGPATGAQPRGRKRQRTHPQPAPPASTLVVNRRNPPARSPTPPTRVIKSTYGGNLFTSDDVMYLKKYIDYCQEQGLVLSLREICERIAVKAPHHTFYSWRRYCNKHQIRLGGYAMDATDADLDDEQVDGQANGDHMPGQLDPPPVLPAQGTTSGVTPGTIASAKRAAQADVSRARSPTPPRALFRSTTGKGVAFTDEDVTFLVRFLEYRNRTLEGKVDMVLFWKEVAMKAPHHSRASWMKFYRRHKHELHHMEGDEPLPRPPPKKMRYSKADDVLLARYFYTKPDGTSDKVFQDFGRLQPHHPWKGWQEHHRIHKAKIDHLVTKLEANESIDEAEEEEE